MSVVTVFSGIVSVAKIPSQSSRPSRKGKDRLKTVQIPYELFVASLRYHLLEDDCCAEEIRQGMEQKLDSLVRHELYRKYKTAPTKAERENARQEYLDRRGMPDSFRW